MPIQQCIVLSVAVAQSDDCVQTTTARKRTTAPYNREVVNHLSYRAIEKIQISCRFF